MTKAKPVDQLIKRPWTKDEDDALRAGYGVAEDISTLVPTRTRTTIIARASVLKIPRNKHRPHPWKIVSPVIVRDGVAGKACVECLVWLPLEKFGRHSTCSGGRRNLCTTCEGRIAEVRYPEQRRAAGDRWRAKNPQRLLINNERRRCRMSGGRGVTLEEYREILDLYDHRCAYCGSREQITMDHFIPLARGGEHDVDNIVPACWPCNASKHTLTGFEFDERRRVQREK